MKINRNTFSNYTQNLLERADEITQKILRRGAIAAKQFIAHPQHLLRIRRKFQNATQEAVKLWQATQVEWIENTLPQVYLRGIEETNGVLSTRATQQEVGTMQGKQVFGPSTEAGFISKEAEQLLKKYPEHWTPYSVFERAAKRDLGRTFQPILREADDIFRQLSIEAGRAEYLAGDTFTRRQVSEDLLRRFADRGITGITYSNGARMELGSYAEMVGRTMTGNTARQASLNRASQYGYDLVRMSTHARSSPMCEPWQGGVYSQSGQHNYYPALSEAVTGGAFHPSCLHSLSPYFPGVSPALETQYSEGEQQLIDQYGEKKGTELAYQAQQQSRYHERQIRRWKRRETTALTKAERVKSGRKVRAWQARQRDHLDEYPFLPRKYFREAA